MYKPVFGRIRMFYRRGIGCFPLGARFKLVRVLAIVLTPLYLVHTAIDSSLKVKYKRDVDIPPTLVWLLYPLRKTLIDFPVAVDEASFKKLFFNRDKGLLVITHHALFNRLLIPMLTDSGLKPITLGVHKEERLFGQQFKNHIQPDASSLIKIRTHLLQTETAYNLISHGSLVFQQKKGCW